MKRNGLSQESGRCLPRVRNPSLCRRESVEVVWESHKDATRESPKGSVPGMSSWEEAMGQTEEIWERLYL